MNAEIIPFTRPTRHEMPRPGVPTPTSLDGDTRPRIVPAVYTVAEVAELLSLSTGSAYGMIRSGQIPAKKMGGRWVIPKHRFHTWLNDLPEADTEDLTRELGRLP